MYLIWPQNIESKYWQNHYGELMNPLRVRDFKTHFLVIDRLIRMINKAIIDLNFFFSSDKLILNFLQSLLKLYLLRSCYPPYLNSLLSLFSSLFILYPSLICFYSILMKRTFIHMWPIRFTLYIPSA